jgi:hypothetical protein
VAESSALTLPDGGNSLKEAARRYLAIPPS